MSDEARYAVLIDAENVSPKYIKIIFDEVSSYGITTYRRIYGDWTSTRNNGWKGLLLENSITPIQQYSYTEGKNSSDSAMIIDAMDILYTLSVDGFVLVSSDSDFTRLASRLRESAMNVIGMGESKTPSAFISACNSFKYLDILYESKEEEGGETLAGEDEGSGNAETGPCSSKDPGPGKKGGSRGHEKLRPPKSKDLPQPQTKLSTIRRTLKSIIVENSDDDSWMSLANLGNQLSKRYPDFDVRNYGHRKLVDFVKSLGDFDLEARSSSEAGAKQIFIRIKTGHYQS